MKSFFQSLKISFVIIGTVIGAGFLSGKEIIQFFYGSDMAFTVFVVFTLFFIGLVFLLKASAFLNSKTYFISKYLILFGNLIIFSGMLSAVDSLYINLFKRDQALPVCSIITLAFSNIVMFKGTKGLEKVNLILVPVIILVLIISVLNPKEATIINTGNIKPVNILSYVGMNLFLAIPVLNGLGENQSNFTRFSAAFISSLVLTGLIFLVLTCVNGVDRMVLSVDLPILYLLSKKKALSFVYGIVLYFGILTTLLSAHYPLYNYFDDDTYGVIGRVFISIIAFLLSRIGFYNIVAFIYPALGVLGCALIVIFAFQSVFSRKTQRQNTLSLPKSKE